MKIFGLEPGAQIIILQALATYAALGSAWFFARPVLRGQNIAASKSVLSGVTSPQAEVAALLKRATELLEKREVDNHPLAKRDNKFGLLLLALSVVLFTIAVIEQIEAEPSLHPAPAASVPGAHSAAH
jgi:hypothetical protein